MSMHASTVPATRTRPASPEAATPTEGAAAGKARRGLAAVIAGALCIAASPVLVRLSELEPTATGFYRVALAVPVFGLWAFAGGRRGRAARTSGDGAARTPDRPPLRRLLATVVLAGLLFAADLACWHWSLRFTTVANSTFLANLAPIFVATLAWFLFRERVTPVFLLGMAFAIGGASLMVRANFRLGASHLQGDLLALTTSMLYAGYLVSVKGLRRRLSTVHLMFYTTLVSGAALLGLSLAAGESLTPPTARAFLVVLALAWVSQVLGQGLIAYGLAHVPASFSSVSLLLQPVAAALLAWAVLGEAVSWWQALGGVGVLAGIALARAGSGQTAAARPKEARPV